MFMYTRQIHRSVMCLNIFFEKVDFHRFRFCKILGETQNDIQDTVLLIVSVINSELESSLKDFMESNNPFEQSYFSIFQSDFSDRELTDANILTLSSRLMKDSVRRLALHLGVSSADIDSSFNDHPAGKEAANHILTNWLHGQNNRKEAYRNMGEALRHKDVKLKLIAREELDYPPVGQNQD